jgi:hypothetical protein
MFKRALISIGAIAPMLVLTAPSVQAQTACTFSDGFAALTSAIPDQVGACDENEHQLANGNVVQATDGGLLSWSPADNLPEFTNGSQTWVLGPRGLQVRSNSQRFPYEAPQTQVAGVALPGQPDSGLVSYVASLINATGTSHPVSTSQAVH